MAALSVVDTNYRLWQEPVESSLIGFNIGGRDGLFLESILDRAAARQTPVRARIDLQTQTYRGLTAINGLGVVRGSSSRGFAMRRMRR